MNTTKKGDDFEQRVYDALSGELQNERLCASPKAAKIFRRRTYYSKDRGADIITDVSIEVFLPERERPSLIWVFECKDYAGGVAVDDIEEFHAKIQQIGEDNTKGTLVTSGALQRSALSYAHAKHIGVIRLLPTDQLIIVLELLHTKSGSAETGWGDIYNALTVPAHRSRNGFFALKDDSLFLSWRSLLSHELSA